MNEEEWQEFTRLVEGAKADLKSAAMLMDAAEGLTDAGAHAHHAATSAIDALLAAETDWYERQ